MLPFLFALQALADEGYNSWHLLYGDDNGGLYIQIKKKAIANGSGGYYFRFDYLYRNTTKVALKGDVIVDILWANPKDTKLNFKKGINIPAEVDNKQFPGDFDYGPTEVLIKGFTLQGSATNNSTNPNLVNHNNDPNWYKITHSDGTVEWVPRTLTFPGSKKKDPRKDP
jgi:hypothetical protein